MKKIIYTLFFIVIVLSIQTVTAQIDRRNGGQQNQMQMQPPPSKPSKPVDPIVSTVTFLKDELELDVFQEAAVTVYVKENFAEIEKIVAQNSSNDQKLIQSEKINNELNQKISELLNPDQLKKFEIIIENRKKGKETSKKKKKREKDN